MKTRITYFVDGRDGTSYNGETTTRAKATREQVITSTFEHAAKIGFTGKPITITATGCAQPMLAEIVQPPAYIA